ncbi:alpha/beta-hydrolase family protein [Cellulomonas soli]|uniref:alpha/beta-hydrolase family protein n=1 Tax=Cellulomonas soli TaxID=931535 RepID=UPI003F83EFF6
MSEARRQQIYSGGLDVSARAGLLLGAYSTGLSYQPNLLSRGTRDQAVISGVAAATAYGWGVTAHSFLRSTADRFPLTGRSAAGRVAAGAAVDTVAALTGLAVTRLVPSREHESPRRALVRLAGVGLCAAATAGTVADALELRRGRPGARTASLLTALGAVGVGYAMTRPGTATRGSLEPGDDTPRENVVREVELPRALASGVVLTGLLMGAARGESLISGTAARAAALTLGGMPDDHRALGRLVSTGALYGVGWGLVSVATTVLNRAGTELEEAHATPPDTPEVTGGPGSLSTWADQTRESRRWLSMALSPEAITRVMGEPAVQPIRVYGSLAAARTPQERAELLLAEIDRTGALDRSVFALFSPTGSGYVNYVATETLEHLTRGDCASASIQYSVLPSALSLTKVGYATEQTRIVVNGLVERLLARPASARPRFFLFGESLGSQVSQEMFRGQGTSGPSGIGLDAAVWIGTPASTDFRAELWGDRSVAQAPDVGPGGFFLPRGIRDWRSLPPDARARVRFLLLQNGDDPVPKFAAPLLWRRPDWLGPTDSRPPGAPRHTRWLPAVSFVTTFVDLQNALAPTPGVFDEGGHDYRREIPEALRTVFELQASEAQMARVQEALRTRELVWAARRVWAKALATPPSQDAEAVPKAIAQLSAWTGRELDRQAVEDLVGTPV